MPYWWTMGKILNDVSRVILADLRLEEMSALVKIQ